MILTGKAKDDFETGIIEILKQKYNEEIKNIPSAISFINKGNDLIKYPHIIEWFDSIGVYIEVSTSNLNIGQFDYTLRDDKRTLMEKSLKFFEDRNEATKQAIIHANQLYNEN